MTTLPALPGPYANGDTPDASELNAVTENVAAAVGRPGVLVRRTVDQGSITSGALLLITWSVADSDDYTMLNSSDKTQVIIRADGRYTVTLQVPFTLNNVGHRVAYGTKNSTTVSTGSYLTGGCHGIGQIVTAATEERFVAGDILRVFVEQDSGSTLALLSGYGGTRMSVRWAAP